LVKSFLIFFKQQFFTLQKNLPEKMITTFFSLIVLYLQSQFTHRTCWNQSGWGGWRRGHRCPAFCLLAAPVAALPPSHSQLDPLANNYQILSCKLSLVRQDFSYSSRNKFILQASFVSPFLHPWRILSTILVIHNDYIALLICRSQCFSPETANTKYGKEVTQGESVVVSGKESRSTEL